jgi:AraC-like DNA-binding protein
MTGSGDEQGSFEERLRLQIEAYHEAALVYAAVKLGLPDRMGTRAWTSEQLTAELGLSPPHLLRLLRGLSTLGICEELPDGSFALAPAG